GLAVTALQQPQLTRRRLRCGRNQPAAIVRIGQVDPPFGEPALGRQGGRAIRLGEEFGHVETDTAGTDDRRTWTDLDLALQDSGVADHAGMVGARKVDRTCDHTGGQYDVIEVRQLRVRGAGVQAKLDAGQGDPALEVAQGLVELFLAGDAFGQIELAADLPGRL